MNRDEPPTPIPPPEQVFEPLKPHLNTMEVFLLILCIWSATSRIFINPEPLSVAVLLGTVWAVVWSIGLLTGATLALVGLLWKGKGIVAVALQETGYVLFAALSFARVIALISIDRPEDAPVVGIFALACTCRVIQLENRIRRLNDSDSWLKRWFSNG